MCLIYL